MKKKNFDLATKQNMNSVKHAPFQSKRRQKKMNEYTDNIENDEIFRNPLMRKNCRWLFPLSNALSSSGPNVESNKFVL